MSVFKIRIADGSIIDIPDGVRIDLQGITVIGDNVTDWNEPIQQSLVNLSSKVIELADNKVDKVTGKGLSTEDFSTEEKQKLSGVAIGAEVNTVYSVSGKVGDVVITKTDIGLGSVDNTPDNLKSVATAGKLTNPITINGVAFDGSSNIVVEDNTKEPKIATGTSAQYIRGDKTLGTMPTSLPASDVYAWAKAANKPTYSYNELLDLPAGGVNGDIDEYLGTVYAGL